MHRALQIKRDALNLVRSGRRLQGRRPQIKRLVIAEFRWVFKVSHLKGASVVLHKLQKKCSKPVGLLNVSRCQRVTVTASHHHRTLITGQVCCKLQQRPPRLARSPDYCRNIHTNAVERGVSVWTTSAGARRAVVKIKR